MGNVPRQMESVLRNKSKETKGLHKEFKWDAIRFSNKVYAVFHEAKRTDADVLIWMDADSIVHSTVTPEDFERLLPTDSLCIILEVKWSRVCFLFMV